MLPPKRSHTQTSPTHMERVTQKHKSITIDPAWKELTPEARYKKAKNALVNEVWINKKSGKPATILQNGNRRIFLELENGKPIKIQTQHFADQYSKTIMC